MRSLYIMAFAASLALAMPVTAKEIPAVGSIGYYSGLVCVSKDVSIMVGKAYELGGIKGAAETGVDLQNLNLCVFSQKGRVFKAEMLGEPHIVWWHGAESLTALKVRLMGTTESRDVYFLFIEEGI